MVLPWLQQATLHVVIFSMLRTKIFFHIPINFYHKRIRVNTEVLSQYPGEYEFVTDDGETFLQGWSAQLLVVLTRHYQHPVLELPRQAPRILQETISESSWSTADGLKLRKTLKECYKGITWQSLWSSVNGVKLRKILKRLHTSHLVYLVHIL